MGITQRERLRVPKVKAINSTMRWSGSKPCKCGVTISKNKETCLACNKENQ